MKILVPSKGPDSWRELLRDPQTQWRDDYSAKELACAWELAKGFPPEVALLFGTSGVEFLRVAEPLLAIPEHQVPLPGSERAPSQTDLFVLARACGKLIAVAVEGKANESFGPTMAEWMRDASPGKRERIAYLKSVLGLSGAFPDELRYQLLHRAASALIEAQRFGAAAAVFLVHSFVKDSASVKDFDAFLTLFGAHHDPGTLAQLGSPGGVQLFAGWAYSDPGIRPRQ